MNNKRRTVPLSEICDINPRLGKAKLSEDELIAFVPMAAVGAANGSIDVSSKRPFAEVKKGFTPFQSGDVLFAKITPCMENGKMAVVPRLANHYGFGSTEFHVLRPKNGIDARYLYYFVSRQDFRKEAARHMTGAVGQKRVPTDFIKQSIIPLPPTIEDQQRIVAEIEKQFSRLDEAVASLKRIQSNLKRYKAAVLMVAVEGKLTEKWRKEHPDVEPAEQLLKRILAERRAKWEAEELARMKAKGSVGAKHASPDSWKKKYKEPAGPDTANLPDLPEGWVWRTLEGIALNVVDCPHSTPKWTEWGQLCARTSDFSPGRLNLEKMRYVSDETFAARNTRLVPKPGDVLYSREGAILGIACLIPPDVHLCLGQRMILIRPSDTVCSAWIMNCLNSQFIVHRVQMLTGGSASPHLNVNDIREFPIPHPRPAEQQQIIAEIDRRLSVTEELEATIETNLKRAERLRQTILQKAFSDGLE